MTRLYNVSFILLLIITILSIHTIQIKAQSLATNFIENNHQNANNNNNNNNIIDLNTSGDTISGTKPPSQHVDIEQNNVPTTPHSFTLEETCASATNNCTACYNITGCHFCEFDLQCHAIGSIYGCIYGMTCETDQCIRKTSEFHGYGHLGFTFVLLVLFGATILFVCLIAILQYCCFGCYYFKLCLGREPSTSSHVQLQTDNTHYSPPTYIVAHHYPRTISTNNLPTTQQNLNNNNSVLTNASSGEYAELFEENQYAPPRIASDVQRQ